MRIEFFRAVFAAALLLAAGVLNVSEAADASPLERLGFWIGSWSIQAEATENPIYPAGKYSAKLKGEWFQGKSHVICHFEWQGPDGPYSEMQIFGYNAETKAPYTYDIDSTGFGAAAPGTLYGKSWTYLYDLTVQGKPLKMRWTVEEVSVARFTWKTEIAAEGEPWKLIGWATVDRQ